MVRRAIFAVSVVAFPEQIFLQIACAFTGAVTMIIYLGHKWPFDSPFSTKMEIFNECTNILLIYHMMMFTDWVYDPVRRYTIGYVVILVVVGNIATHFSFLI